MILNLTLSELVTVHKFVRDQRDKGGRELNPDLMLEVYRGITAVQQQLQAWFKDNPNAAGNPNADIPDPTWPVDFSEEDLWQLTRTVDVDYIRGKKFCGFTTIVKAAEELSNAANPSWRENDVNILVEALDEEVRKNVRKNSME